MIKINPIDIVYACLPAVAGYGASAACEIGSSAGSSVKFRPPAQAFGIIWAILFPLFGISWAVACRESNTPTCIISYGGTTAFLALWIYVYGCKKNKKAAVWVLVGAVAFALLCFTQGNTLSKMLVAPLIAWALFALLMNSTEVQNS
jgi:tryptophan-rich sensory protein